MPISKATERLELLTKTAEAFIPHVNDFKKVQVKITWVLLDDGEVNSGFFPNVDVTLEKL